MPTPLTNFTARIKADISEDDGAEVGRLFEIEAILSGRRHAFTVPARQFPGMGWVAEHLGAGAIVQPGFGIKDHARAAIQTLSGEIPARRIYAHTGWRKIGGEWLYLHAGGAVGVSADGEGSETRVELSGTLRERELPTATPEGEELRGAIRGSLGLLKVAPDGISYPLLAAAYRAPLGESDFSLHLSGPTGEGKSEEYSLFQQHYGAELDARSLLSWGSTENKAEAEEVLENLSVPGLKEGISPEEFEGWTAGLLQRAIEQVTSSADREGSEAVLEAAMRSAEWKVKKAKQTAEEVERDLERMSRERLLPDEKTLEKIARYEAHLSRGLYKALHELEALQVRRTGGAAPLARLDVDGLVDS